MEHKVGISQTIIDTWQKQIDLLKPKKRKNWKSLLTDKWGVKSKVKYEDGKFYNWCVHRSDWAKIISLKESGIFKESVNKSPFKCCLDMIFDELNITDPDMKEIIFDIVIKQYVQHSHTGNHTPMAERDSPNKRRYAIPTM
jgi:hypothetical protein